VELVTITVASHKPTTSTKNNPGMIVSDGVKRYYIWSHPEWFGEIRDGCTLELMGDYKGDFFNPAEFKVSDGSVALAEWNPDNDITKPQAKPPKPDSAYKADPAKTSSIQNQVALKCAVELGVAMVIPADKIIPAADVFKKFLDGDITFSPEEQLLNTKILKDYTVRG